MTASRQDPIIQTAVALFANEGLAVPTSRIAQQASVATGTLFNHFPSKQVLIDAIYLDIKDELSELFLVDAGHARDLPHLCQLIWHTYANWAQANPQRHATMKLFRDARALSDEALRQSESLFAPLNDTLKTGMAAGVIRRLEMPYFYQIFCAQVEACIAMSSGLKAKALQNHLNTGYEIFWRGVSA